MTEITSDASFFHDSVRISEMTRIGGLMNGYPLDSIRANYTALQEMCYLNTGTVGVMSEPVLTYHLDNIVSYERYGHFAESRAREGYERAREAFADLINASPAEIALTRNASDGVNFVLSGLEFKTGKSIVSTNEEHPAVLLPADLATRKSGGSVILLDLNATDEELLDQLRDALSSTDVQLAILSHVSCETGRRLPINAMCQICRDAGVLTLVDGAQSVGQIEVDVVKIGCDFMTGNGHKWLCGPKGTGFLYVNRERIEELTPPYAGDGAVEPRFDRAMFDNDHGAPQFGFRADAQRFEFGTRNWHMFGAVAESIDTQRNLGWPSIFDYVEKVSDYTKKALEKRSGITVVTPASWSESCGIVTFTAEGWDGVELSNRLWEDHQIIQRRVQIPSGVRISCAHYTSTADIDQFLEALDATI